MQLLTVHVNVLVDLMINNGVVKHYMYMYSH